ncbi:hypothetical protein CEXT_365901 [Caerostris extrusa]|uniref:Uncharacterized protein n=1 Tax=Caerostris extrusa TaxID=172846 RepID=A0AAV4PHL9_CAEEX|nr:hypothetical protein CEXT_365901 [Caerostris extrusa]
MEKVLSERARKNSGQHVFACWNTALKVSWMTLNSTNFSNVATDAEGTAIHCDDTPSHTPFVQYHGD